MFLDAFTLFHVALSLIGIGSGLVVLYGLIASKLLHRWNTAFLASTVATSVTGFLFPIHGLTPGHVVGIISLIVLAVAITALYRRRLGGAWRRTYVITSGIALYLNFFVLIVQLFQKVPLLHEFAPTGSETPFKITQLIALVVFALLIIRAASKFRQPVVEPRARSASAG